MRRGAGKVLCAIILVASAAFGRAQQAKTSAPAKAATTKTAATTQKAEASAAKAAPAAEKAAASATAAKAAPATASGAAAVLVAPHTLDKADVEAFFDGIFAIQEDRSDIAGATVLVMRDGQVVLEKGYGYADMKQKTPVDPATTAFRIASISKLFTWVSVMQLVEQGKIDIDADVNKYLDYTIRPAFGKPITLRNLMTHTGGFEEADRDLIVVDPKWKIPLRQYMMDDQPMRMFAPGAIPAYSNYGVGVAGYIVQRVGGVPYEQYVHDHIFAPLGMTHSSFEEPPATGITVSEGYRGTNAKPVGFEFVQPAPAGGMTTTAADMGRFGMMLLNGGELDGQRILKPETVAAMWTPQFRASDLLPAICMGFYQTVMNGVRFIGHDGDLVAFHSRFELQPESKTILFVSYNSAGSAGLSRVEVLREFAARYYPPAEAPHFLQIPAAQLREYTGNYLTTRREDSTKLAITNALSQPTVAVDKEGVLTVDAFLDAHGHTAKWKPIGKDLFAQVDGAGKIFFIRNANGRVVRMTREIAMAQWQRVPWWERGELVLSLACASLLAVLLPVLASVVRFGRKMFFRKRPQFAPQPGTARLTAWPRLACWAWVATLAIVIAFVSYAASDSSLPPTRALEKYFVLENYVAAVAIFFSLWAVLSGIRVWRRELRVISKLKYTIVALACVYLTYFSIYYRVIGPAHRY